MKLASFNIRGRTSFGAIVGEGVVDLRLRLSRFPSLLDVLRAGALEEAMAAARGVRADFAVAEAEFLPPIQGPEKIVGVVENYPNSKAESADGGEPRQYPRLFTRMPGSFVGHEQTVIRPKESEQFDYGGAIALAIGRGGRRIAKEEALSHVAGLMLCNDGAVRGWASEGKEIAMQGWNFDRSGGLGPWMVTADEIDWEKPLRITTSVNGEMRQDEGTAHMVFPPADLIAHISVFTTLKPGDLILTGTPAGTGAQSDPPRWLTPGDVVEIRVPEIGTLRNRVAAEE